MWILPLFTDVANWENYLTLSKHSSFMELYFNIFSLSVTVVFSVYQSVGTGQLRSDFSFSLSLLWIKESALLHLLQSPGSHWRWILLMYLTKCSQLRTGTSVRYYNNSVSWGRGQNHDSKKSKNHIWLFVPRQRKVSRHQSLHIQAVKNRMLTRLNSLPNIKVDNCGGKELIPPENEISPVKYNDGVLRVASVTRAYSDKKTTKTGRRRRRNVTPQQLLNINTSSLRSELTRRGSSLRSSRPKVR